MRTIKKIELQCKHCSKSFDKELKEYTRQTKFGKTNFFCSRHCSGLHNIANLPDPATNPWCLNLEHLQRMAIMVTEKNTKYTKEERPFYNLLRKTQRRYYKENNLDVQFIKELWEKQAGKCAITNISLNLRGTDYNTNASIDRISSSVGYIKGNIQIVSTAINLAKNNSSNESALEFVRLIIENAKI